MEFGCWAIPFFAGMLCDRIGPSGRSSPQVRFTHSVGFWPSTRATCGVCTPYASYRVCASPPSLSRVRCTWAKLARPNIGRHRDHVPDCDVLG
ncbi:hypothetical protein M8J75_008350 [Diaphorina citri]|nr:hypothetical protein M8J75_008350 [Diaphorina citri]